MRYSALRTLSKISSNALKNSRRPFSFKFEMTPASRLASDPEEAKPAEEEKKPPSFRYNVCQPRTSSLDRPSFENTNVSNHPIRATIEEQHLQPAMLPHFYEKQMGSCALLHPEPEETEKIRIEHANTQKFQVSKTYANAILPLKSVKLANPFPEPVKMMMSRTVSDDEKAAQMLADSRGQASFSTFGGKRPFATAVRKFSSVGSDPEKCKKLKKKKGGCPKMTVKKCPPPARTTCVRQPKHLDCKKQQAPYPAYSEFCHEELEERPSECKMCPWKPDENPNFKPKKRKFHTCSAVDVKRTGLEALDWNAVVEEAQAEGEAALRCDGDDLRKPKCERPKNRRCPPTKEEKRKQEEKKKKKDKKCAPPADLVGEAVLPSQQTQAILSLRGESKDKTKGPCKIKKFKFPKCEPIKRNERPSAGRCPPKKKKPLVKDCPPEEKSCEAALEQEEGLLLASDEKKRQCPKVDLTVDKDQLNQGCRKKRNRSKECPSDLITKKQKPRNKPRRNKRASSDGIVPPVEDVNAPQTSKTL